MNLVRFCENRFQEVKMLADSSTEYDANSEAEIKAIQAVLNIYRTTLKWIMVPKCLFDFMQVKLGFSDEPQPVLINKLKSDKLAKEVADKMLAKGNVTSIDQAKVCESAPETPAN